jgi:hypothetical protein
MITSEPTIREFIAWWLESKYRLQPMFRDSLFYVQLAAIRWLELQKAKVRQNHPPGDVLLIVGQEQSDFGYLLPRRSEHRARAPASEQAPPPEFAHSLKPRRKALHDRRRAALG